MIRRARLVAVVAIVLAGALGVVSSTQTWLTVVLRQGGQDPLAVAGASALPVLTPLSLAVLALGIVVSIAGVVLRHVVGAIAVAIAGVLLWLTVRIAVEHPTSSFASVVTGATGITGAPAIDALVARVDATPWPAITIVVWTVLLAAGALVLATARTWQGSGRRYRTDADRAETSALRSARPQASRPHDAARDDAIDSWDDLSRGEDPTDR